MTSAIGWYGPLIDLYKAASHVGDFVQLLVFVHRSTPVQYKLAKGGTVIRTDIQVGDDTRPFFSVSLWQREMASAACAGDVILLQNVKITKFGDAVEARTVQCSSLLCLVHPYYSLVSKGVDELIGASRVGMTSKEKLRKVIEWVQRTGSALHNIDLHSNQRQQLSRNWKLTEEKKSRDCFSLSEVSHLTNSCKAIFYASIGEIFLPFTGRALGGSEKEKMFISRRLSNLENSSLVEDLICTGCQLCGSPLDLEYGSPIFEQNSIPLYCRKSSNRLHVESLIYRPFMLYVWDESDYMPLHVRNKAAELLFGNIRAERVYLSYRGQKHDQNTDPKDVHKENQCDARTRTHRKAAGEGIVSPCLSLADKNTGCKEEHRSDKNMNFYVIWLILLKIVLQQGNNSCLKFEVSVDVSLDRENGRFEMSSLSMPCFRTKSSSV